jgi:hypothetical protein
VMMVMNCYCNLCRRFTGRDVNRLAYGPMGEGEELVSTNFKITKGGLSLLKLFIFFVCFRYSIY